MKRRVVYQKHIHGLSHETRVVVIVDDAGSESVRVESKHYDSLGEPSWSGTVDALRESVLACAVVELSRGLTEEVP